jgi:hypothetical protein
VVSGWERWFLGHGSFLKWNAPKRISALQNKAYGLQPSRSNGATGGRQLSVAVV